MLRPKTSTNEEPAVPTLVTLLLTVPPGRTNFGAIPSHDFDALMESLPPNATLAMLRDVN